MLSSNGYRLQQVNEASLSRVITRYWPTGFIIISANRSAEAELGRTPTPEEEEEQQKRNAENDSKIKQMIRAAGFGYVPTWGGYRETVVDPETGEEKLQDTVTPEPSYIVPAMKLGSDSPLVDTTSLRQLGMKLAAAFNQDSFLYKPSDIEGGSAVYLDRYGNEQMSFGGITANDMLQTYYTQLRKKPGRFTLTEWFIAAPPTSVSEARKRYGEKFWRFARSK